MHEQPSLWKLITALPRGIAFVIVGLGSFLATQWRQYTPFGQMLWVLSLIAISVDAGISYQFGSTLSILHAAGFGLVALAFCILPDVSWMEFKKGRKTTGKWIAASCIPLGAVAFLTHLGYSATIRVGDFQQSDVHNAVYQDARSSVPQAQKNLKVAEANLAEFTAKKPWVTTVTADGLNAQAGAMQEQIRQEEARGGCGPKCLALKQKQADLIDRAAAATHKTDLERQRADAIASLEKAKANAAKATYVSSTAVNHTDTLFKAVSFLRGDFTENVTMADRDVTNTGIMGISSIAFLLLAPLFYLAAGLNRRPGVLDAWIHGHEEHDQIKLHGDTKAPGAGGIGGIHNSLAISDERAIKYLREMAARMKLPAPAEAAA